MNTTIVAIEGVIAFTKSMTGKGIGQFKPETAQIIIDTYTNSIRMIKADQKEDNKLMAQRTRAMALLAMNYKKDHFEIIFKESDLGWEYMWDKFVGFTEEYNNSPTGFMRFVLYLDGDHLRMLNVFLQTYR